MSQLTCAGCGSVYPLAGVQKLDAFTCSVCHRIIVVPIAGPSAARKAQAPPPRPDPGVPPPIPARAAPRPAPPKPPAPKPREPAPRDGDPSRMAPLAGLGHAVTALYIVYILTRLVGVYCSWVTILFVDGLRPGVAPDMERARQIDANTEASTVAAFVAFTVMGLLFCAWFHRAHSNLRAAKLPKMEYASGWAVGGFFVPILNFVRPAQVMAETWAGTSYLAGESRVSSWKRSPSNPLVAWWWGLHLLAGVVAIAGTFLSGGSAVTASWFKIGSALVAVGSSAAGIALVHRIGQLQDWARRKG